MCKVLKNRPILIALCRMLKVDLFIAQKSVKVRPSYSLSIETLKSGYFYCIKIKLLLQPPFVKSWLPLQPSLSFAEFGAPDLRSNCMLCNRTKAYKMRSQELSPDESACYVTAGNMS